MNILYIVETIVFFIILLILKKSDNKLNIIKHAIIMVFVIMCCNLAYSAILSIAKIPVNLQNVVICQGVLILLCLIKLIKDRKIQKYEISIKDVVFLLLAITLITAITYISYGKFDQLSYVTNDPDVHFQTSKIFYKTENMFIEGKEGFQPFLYTNEGIAFKAFEPIIGEFNLYKIYVFVDVSVLFIAVMLFYFIIKDKIGDGILKYIIACVVSIIFILGYPLNNLLTGFHYLQAGINAILLAVILINEDIKKGWKTILLAVANICVIFTYNLFAPLVYIAEFIFFLKENYNEEKKFITKHIIFQTIFAFVIPGILAILYFLVFRGNSTDLGLMADGYIVRNKITAIAFFIPFTLYYIVNRLKNKKVDFNVIFVISLILYVILFIVLFLVNKISSYYYFKIYYLIWPFIILASTYGIITFFDKGKIRKIISLLLITAYIGVIAFIIFKVDYDFTGNLGNEEENIASIAEIYSINKRLLKDGKILTKDDMECISYINDNLNSNEVLFVSHMRQQDWKQVLITKSDPYCLKYDKLFEEIEDWNKGKYKYIALLKDSSAYIGLQGKISLKNAKKIYSNNTTEIWEKETVTIE